MYGGDRCSTASRLVLQSARTRTASSDQNAFALGVQPLTSGLLSPGDQRFGAREPFALGVHGGVFLFPSHTECVVGSARAPAVHRDEAGRMIEAPKELGSEVAFAGAKEPGPDPVPSI